MSTNASSRSSSVLVKLCPSYDDAAALRACAEACLAHADPDGRLVAPGRRVLLKVNMLSARPPEHAVTTHPALVRAVAEACIARGAEVRIGDSPGAGERNLESYWDVTGMAEAAAATGAALVNFAAAGSFRTEIDGLTVHITEAIRDVDTVINLPKLKTHSITMMTAALKNCYGVLPGPQKSALHTRRPDANGLSRFIVELHRFVDPAITILDAVTAMEGNGPSAGDPRHMGFLLAGSDAAAVDWIASRMMGFDPRDVPTNRAAEKLGLTAPDEIEVTGDAKLTEGADGLILPSHLPAVRVQAWLLNHMPRALSALASKLFRTRPRMTEDCTGCGACVEKCPADALRLADGEVILKERACIGCMCCQEICPHRAVEVKLSFVARMIRAGT